MKELMSKQTMDGMIAAVIRNSRGKVPHEISSAIMDIIWPEFTHLAFELDALEREHTVV